MPPAAICDKKGKKLLSWRVAILPFIEQDNLYKLYNLNTATDNQTYPSSTTLLASTVIKTYLCPSDTTPAVWTNGRAVSNYSASNGSCQGSSCGSPASRDR